MRFVFPLLLLAHLVIAQTAPESGIYSPAEVGTPPQFPGGESALLRFFTENIRYRADAAQSNYPPGKTVVVFVVRANGHVSDIEIAKGDSTLGREIKRVVGTMPAWTPATLDGVPVDVRMTIPLQLEFDRHETLRQPARVIPSVDSFAVRKGVVTKTTEVYGKAGADISFKLKKKKRKILVRALEAQFQVNLGEENIRRANTAGNLAEMIYRAQSGVTMFSKSMYQGKVERMIGNRKKCDGDGDCLRFPGSIIVPKGYAVTFFSEPKFKGDQLMVDARAGEVRIASFIDLKYGEKVRTTSEAIIWRESIRSIRIDEPAPE